MDGVKDRGNWIQTFRGLRFHHLDPQPDDICIEDIAHALSNLCRFAGHTREFYSVAQHSVLASKCCPDRDALWGLLHDAAEAYCVDVPRPLKHMPGMEPYRATEDAIMQVIADKFGLPWPQPDSVKWADETVLFTEKRDLLVQLSWSTDPTSRPHPPMEARIVPWAPRRAEAAFLTAFGVLTGDPRYSPIECQVLTEQRYGPSPITILLERLLIHEAETWEPNETVGPGEWPLSARDAASALCELGNRK